MGNALGGKRRAKVMKIDGSTVKVKPPAAAEDVLRDHPGFVLLESEQVKLLGIRAKPLQPDQPLKPRKLYFLVELPKMPQPAGGAVARRVRSGVINMSARDRLESLMLSRRTASDMTFVRAAAAGAAGDQGEGDDGLLRVRLRLPKAQVARLVEESGGDPAEAAEKIMELCAGGRAPARRAASGPLLAVAERAAVTKAVSGPIREKEKKRMRFAITGDEIIG